MSRRGGDRRARASTSTTSTSTARAAPTAAELDALEARGLRPRPLAAAQPLLRRRGAVELRAGRRARTRPATRAAAGTASSSSDRRSVRRAAAGRRAGARRARRARRRRAGGLADPDGARGAARATSGATCGRCADHARGRRVVAEAEDGEIVGRLSRRARPAAREPPRRRRRPDGRARYRRRGIGRALLDAAERWARERGVRKLELHVFPHNEAAIALYERAGFVREGYRHEPLPPRRHVFDAILMATT